MCIIISISYVLLFVAGQCLNEIESFTVTKNKGLQKPYKNLLWFVETIILIYYRYLYKRKHQPLQSYMKFSTHFL
jgi:hypothetical protein